MPARRHDYPDDIFATSRMSFGDHIEELRYRMIQMLKGLIFCLLIGFVLDAVGQSAGWDNFGIGRPMFNVITGTVEAQVRDFYARRNETQAKKLPDIQRTTEAEAKPILDRSSDGSVFDLSADDKKKLLGRLEPMPMVIPVEPLTKLFGPPKDPGITQVEVTVMVSPAHLNYLSGKGETLLESKKYLTSLSVTEPLMVYFKVSLLCGVVLSCPWLFYHAWAFVAAGLYPHERKYVHLYLPSSVGLFLLGVMLCQLIVLPGAVKSLLGFNNFLDVDPDIRLNEWLGFAIILPLVFGVSFQTPLVMLFMNRLGLFGWQDYLSKWRIAIMVLAVFAAVITPTPDMVTMLYLFVPMLGLYMIGILVCYLSPGKMREDADAEPAGDQVAV